MKNKTRVESECKNCCWFSQFADDKKSGECRIKAPRESSDPDSQAIWPIVDCDDFCGDFIEMPELEEETAEKARTETVVNGEVVYF